MDCTPESLITQAACYRCIPKGSIPSVINYLLCQWVNKPTTQPCHSAVVDDWAVRVSAAAGRKPTDSQLLALCNFMTGMDAAGLTAKMVALNPFCPPDSPGGALFIGELRRALVPLIQGPGNSPWPNVGNAFLTADLTSDGLIGDGTTKWLDPGITTNVSFVVDNIGLSVYSMTAANDSKASIGSGSGTALLGLYVNSGTSSIYYCWNVTSGAGLVTAVNSLWTGFLSGSRLPANPLESLYKGNSGGFSTLATHNGTGGSISTDKIGVFARVSGGLPFDISAKRMSFAALHRGLTAAETQTFFTLVQALRVAFGGGYV
jgi:hypothetical protein